MSRSDRRSSDGTFDRVVTKSRAKTKKPSMYKVLMLNDDYTPMEFVVHVLEKFFAKSREDAVGSCCTCIIEASACVAYLLTKSPKPRLIR